MAESAKPAAADEKVGGVRGLALRVRVLRAVLAECKKMKAEGLVFGSKDEALAALLLRFQMPQGEVAELLKDIDWETIIEIIEQLLPLILAIIQIFLTFL